MQARPAYNMKQAQNPKDGAAPDTATTDNLNDQQEVRRQEVEKLRSMGIDPYPAPTFAVNATATDIKANFAHSPNDYQNVALAGRIMSQRMMGKASFAELQDATGRIQLYLNKDTLTKDGDASLYEEVYKHLTSLGDIVGVTGYVFATKTGETTVHVTSYQILSKSLRPLPTPKEKDGVVHDAFSDPELRYRMRYLDLVVNPQVRETFIKRSKMIQAMREFMLGRGYQEVETPILQPIYGGALARPFKTHHNTLDMTLFLRIANELYLKKLIVGGYDGVFEFAKDFRNEGMSRFHNPEFTMLELYVAYKDYYWMMDCVEEMLEHTVRATTGGTAVQVGEHVIDFARPWKRYTLYGAIKEFTGHDIEHMDEAGVRGVAQKLKIRTDDTMDRGRLIDEIFSTIEPMLIQPTIIMDYPEEMSPLTKKHRSKAGLVERFEAICNGKEICNAYSELNDPIDQRKRFEAQLALRARGDEEAMMLDEDFLRSLEFGMPPTAGIGIGIDRLAMVVCNAPSIQEVIFFPQMRPEQKQQEQ
jgi:lysyl-tRNA synthetase class 2